MSKLNTHATALVAIWENATDVSRQIDNSIGAIHGIGFSEYMVMHHLSEAPNQAMRRIDLADALGRTASGVTRMLLPMEKIGLVEKATNPRDARVSLVSLTKTGQSILTDASATLNEKAEHLLRRLDKGQVKQLVEILGSIKG